MFLRRPAPIHDTTITFATTFQVNGQRTGEQIVQNIHNVALGHQNVHKVGTDEARATRDQDSFLIGGYKLPNKREVLRRTARDRKPQFSAHLVSEASAVRATRHTTSDRRIKENL
jgi:hypothetical protein